MLSQVLEDEGVLQYCDLFECQLDVFPMDNDILSLELDTAFKDCYVDGDTSSLTTVARALLKLQGESTDNLIAKLTNSSTKDAVCSELTKALHSLCCHQGCTGPFQTSRPKAKHHALPSNGFLI